MTSGLELSYRSVINRQMGRPMRNQVTSSVTLLLICAYFVFDATVIKQSWLKFHRLRFIFWGGVQLLILMTLKNK
jgi:cell division protein FtsB